MPKCKMAVVTNSEESRLMLRQVLGRDEEIALLGFVAIDSTVLTKLAGYAPHVVLVVQDREDTGVMEIAQRILEGVKGCALVLLAAQVDLPLMQAAMKAGYRLVVGMQELSALKPALLQAATLEQGKIADGVHDPRVISVYGGKGGAGKTTVAVNLAAAFAESGHRTALVDLCLVFGDAALQLNITAKDTIAELVQEKSIFTIEDVKSFCIQHLSGISVLCSPSSPEYAEYITPRHVDTLISLMRPYYDYIVVDLPSDLSECTLTAMENSDSIVLVSRLDIGGLRASKQTLGILRTLQMEDKVQLLINADHKDVLKHRDFEQVLELPVSFRVPEDIKTARLSLQKGIPFVLGMPRAPISQEIRRLAGVWKTKPERKKNDRRKKA